MSDLRLKLSALLRRGVSVCLGNRIIPPVTHGYIDTLSPSHVAGWMWNPHDAAARLEFDVVLNLPHGATTIAAGGADQFYPGLRDAGCGDGRYGFHVDFTIPVAVEQLRHVIVRPTQSRISLPRAPEIEGYIDELSDSHVSGWIRNRFEPQERVMFEVVTDDTEEGERVLARGEADLPHTPLILQSIGDGKYGFRAQFDAPLSQSERDAVQVRAKGKTAIPRSPYLKTSFEPIDHIAIDIVNNCNLRCPFCLYDYSETKTTRVMAPETFERLLPLLPYVRDGNFWLSCLHEPTLNPDFIRFIERVPAEFRRKVMFTTNLAKRMPAAYFETLACSGVSHINISLESLRPEIFERMRKGARWPIFKENWDRLIAAWESASAPPRLRYIMMAYKSNRDEIPGLVKYLRAERHPWQIEIRHTYNALHIAKDFRRTEFLNDTDWAWLAAQLAEYPVDEVMLIPPPEGASEPAEIEPIPEPAVPASVSAPVSALAFPAESQPVLTAMPWQFENPSIVERTEPAASQSGARRLTQPFNLQVDWDGKFVVYAKWDDPPELKQFTVTNVNELADPYAFLMSL